MEGTPFLAYGPVPPQLAQNGTHFMLLFLHEHHVLFLQPVLQAQDIRFCSVPGAIGSSVPIGVKTPASILQPYAAGSKKLHSSSAQSRTCK